MRLQSRHSLVAKGRFSTIAAETVLRFTGWDKAIKPCPLIWRQYLDQSGFCWHRLRFTR
jgi:hypothetical protein